MAQPPKLNCVQGAYTGKSVLLDFAFGCGDVADPRILNYMPLGSMRAKSTSSTQDTADATTDTTAGFFREVVGTYKEFTVSGDGVAQAKDGSRSNTNMLYKHYLTSQQVNAWVRITYPDITVYAYVLVSDMGRDAPFDDVVTYSIELTATASEHGVIVDDTPVAGVAVESITFTPTSPAALTSVGDTVQIVPTVTPSGANQDVLYSVCDETIATVTQDGLVTAVGTGNCTVTMFAAGNMTVTAEIEIQVTIA